MERGTEYTTYFASDPSNHTSIGQGKGKGKHKVEMAGVGLISNNKIRKAVKDVQQINSIIVTLKIKLVDF